MVEGGPNFGMHGQLCLVSTPWMVCTRTGCFCLEAAWVSGTLTSGRDLKKMFDNERLLSGCHETDNQAETPVLKL